MEWEKGDRVKLVYMRDKYTRIAPGTEGTVAQIDYFGTVHVNWDDGHHLGIIEGVGDVIERVVPSDALFGSTCKHCNEDIKLVRLQDGNFTLVHVSSGLQICFYPRSGRDKAALAAAPVTVATPAEK